MNEPNFIPKLKDFPLSLHDTRFCVQYTKKFIDPSDPAIDPLHLHAYTEFIVHLKGTMSFLIDNHVYALKRGDVVISRPNELHMGMFEKNEEYEYFCVWIENSSDPSLLSFLEKEPFSVLSFDAATANKMQTLLSSVADERATPLQQCAHFLQFLLLLQRAPDNGNSEKALPLKLQNILNDIHINVAEILHVKDLSSRHFVSLSTLNRWFQTHLHVSPHTFLDSERLTQAAKLLAAGATVTEACTQVGFSSCSYFIALFKKKFGETPLKYKQRFV